VADHAFMSFECEKNCDNGESKCHPHQAGCLRTPLWQKDAGSFVRIVPVAVSYTPIEGELSTLPSDQIADYPAASGYNKRFLGSPIRPSQHE
jgi:hypothetical protein